MIIFKYWKPNTILTIFILSSYNGITFIIKKWDCIDEHTGWSSWYIFSNIFQIFPTVNFSSFKRNCWISWSELKAQGWIVQFGSHCHILTLSVQINVIESVLYGYDSLTSFGINKWACIFEESHITFTHFLLYFCLLLQIIVKNIYILPNGIEYPVLINSSQNARKIKSTAHSLLINNVVGLVGFKIHN